ncbi:MAG: SixA phosphatase family protein [Nonlabens sp.]|uniref:SixA phosphatase family protein n=1 Tax=Nonlabens sp. TaxID=1888209 RepID=UPI003EF31C62
MKKLLLLVALLSLSSCNTGPKQGEPVDNQGITTFYFIRHAEKRSDQGSDPELTEQGKKRAEAWVNYFFLKNVDHIISSDYKRTRETAAPLAAAHDMDVEIYDVRNTKAMDLLKKYRGKTVVLFGHSNTINGYTNELQNDSVYNALDDNDYDHYFYARVSESGKSSGVKESMDFMED